MANNSESTKDSQSPLLQSRVEGNVGQQARDENTPPRPETARKRVRPWMLLPILGAVLLIYYMLLFLLLASPLAKPPTEPFSEAGEGLFNLAVNDKSIVYKVEGKVYMGFLEGADYEKLLLYKLQRTADPIESAGLRTGLEEIRHLNAQARGQGVVIFVVISAITTLLVYWILRIAYHRA